MGSGLSTLFGNASDEPRRSLPPADNNEPLETGPHNSSAPAALAIPAEAEATEAPLPTAETSTEKEIRELRQVCKDTKKEKPFPYPRFSLGSEVVSPVKEGNESSRLTGSFADPLWHQEQAYRSESGTASSPSMGNRSGGNASLPAVAASEVVTDPSEVSGSSGSSSRKSTQSGGISTPLRSVGDEASGPSIPFDSTGDFIAENENSNVSSPPPSSAEPTPNKQMKVAVMSPKRPTLPRAPEGAQPTHQTFIFRRSYQSSRSSEEPMEVDKQLKRRSPSDAVLPEHRDYLRAARSRTLSSCASISSGSSSASSPVVTAEAMKMRRCHHQCPRCEQTCQKDDEEPERRTSGKNVRAEVQAWRQRPHNCPICQLKCRPMSLFSSDEEDEESEVSTVSGSIDLNDYLDDVSIVDDAQPAEQEQPLVGIAGSAVPCRSCGRNCPCVPAQRPESPVAAPAPQPRRRRRQEPSVEEAWKQLELVEAICDVTLPAAPPTINEHLELVDSMPLDPNDLLTFLIRDTFQVALYIDGEVVLQGGFLGVEPTTDILREAAKRPVVIINDPSDKVTMIDAGDNHIVMKTESGQVMTLGRAVEGQLGATANPERFRQRAVNPANLRRFPAGPMGIVIESVEATGNTTTAWDEHGNVYRCGEGIGNWLETAKHRADRLAELAIQGL